MLLILNEKLKILHVDVEKVCANQMLVLIVSPHHSIPFQSGDRMEEQLPASERAGQGERLKQEVLSNDNRT